MNRTIVYPGSIPQDTDILSLNRNTMIGIGYLAQAVLGSNVVADGLACSPTSPASMAVAVGPGSITSFGPIDINPYGSLPADTSELVVKMGINLDPVTFNLNAPAATGTAINYLVEASFFEGDTSPAVLPYYNAANPSQPFSGPGNSGTTQNTLRVENVQLRLVTGQAAPEGTQVTPTPDPGWVGLWVITVFSSMTSIGGGTISAYPTAPFLPFKLPELTPGHSSMAVIASNQTWTPPFGTTLVKLRMVGGGGGGGNGGGGGGGGGAGGGYVEGYYAVTAGVSVYCTVGSGGSAGSAGGTSSFGTIASAGGGGAGGVGSSSGGGTGAGTPGAGSGEGLLLSGTPGQSGLANSAILIGGCGGGSFLGQGGAATFSSVGTSQSGHPGALPGTGGGGGIGSGTGGAGSSGLILLEW